MSTGTHRGRRRYQIPGAGIPDNCELPFQGAGNQTHAFARTARASRWEAASLALHQAFSGKSWSLLRFWLCHYWCFSFLSFSSNNWLAYGESPGTLAYVRSSWQSCAVMLGLSDSFHFVNFHSSPPRILGTPCCRFLLWFLLSLSAHGF